MHTHTHTHDVPDIAPGLENKPGVGDLIRMSATADSLIKDIREENQSFFLSFFTLLSVRLFTVTEFAGMKLHPTMEYH